MTKLGVERLVVAARGRGLSAAALRFTTTWGPGKSGETHAGLSFHSDLVAAARRGGDIAVDVHPDQAFDLIYYADVGAAIADACLADGPLGAPVYHLGGGRLTRMARVRRRPSSGPSPAAGSGWASASRPGGMCSSTSAPPGPISGYEPRYDVPPRSPT